MFNLQQHLSSQSLPFLLQQQMAVIYQLYQMPNGEFFNVFQNLNRHDQVLDSENHLKTIDSQPSSPTQFIPKQKQKLLKIEEKKNKNNKQPKNCQNNYCQNKRKTLHDIDINGTNIQLCNRCFLNFNSNNYCEYCIQIYDPSLGYEIDDKEWIQCEKCERWNHVECEKTQGEFNLNKITSQMKYQCQKCRKVLKKLGRPIKLKDTHSEQELQNSKFKYPNTIIKLSNKEISEDLSQLRDLLELEKIDKKLKISQNQ